MVFHRRNRSIGCTATVANCGCSRTYSDSAMGLGMILLGLLLLIIGVLVGVPLLTTVGGILIVVGAVLWILGATGRAVGGRKHYF
ncbi:hypothetical protein ADK56_33585 [Streptomyces sp. MMG1522]|uniref:Uncharacterized protein n=2 Tax=Streptomyces TaxID=1883 RepID=A0A927BJ80_STRGL|nr:hypothetical protein ADK33_08610 [Streptomyces griseus subsp. rhodochrous]KOU10163.1 hypothetical protein ADK88_04390 [Streptomyces sp. NRRL F-2295]KOU45278.1 hypothetical protein ADK56_33585 [Streptomyces sp. MMG1522]MBD2827862.1 hypothetical protein [Streptomyces globisporus]